MPLFRREKRALGDPGNPLIPARPDGRTTAGIMVNADTSMTLSACWASIRLRADLISTTPIKSFRESAGLPVPINTPPLLLAPGGERVTPEEWLFMRQVSLDTNGNAFGQIVRTDGFGFPLQIELIPPDMVGVFRDKNGRVGFRVAGKVVEDPKTIYHERAFVVPGELRGLSPIAYAARSIGVALAAERFGADWFADGGHPSAILSTTQRIDETQAKTIKRRFLSSVQGREPAVLGAGITYTPIQIAPNESQFIEAMRWGVEQIARIYGVPPEMIGGSSGSTMTYANIEQRGLDFLNYGMGATFARAERNLSRLLPTRQFVRYDMKALLRNDTESRYKTHAIGVAAKFLTPDEAREQEDLLPLTQEQKDVLELVPLTITPDGNAKAVKKPGDAGTSPEEN